MSTYNQYQQLFYVLVDAHQRNYQIKEAIKDLGHTKYLELAKMPSPATSYNSLKGIHDLMDELGDFLFVSNKELERYIQKLQPFFMTIATPEELKDTPPCKNQ